VTAVLPEVTVTTDHPLAGALLTPPALELLAWLTRVHSPALRSLLAARTTAAIESVFVTGPSVEDPASAGHWRVAPAPADLADRRVEITGPADRKMTIGALNSGAKVFMADLEDSLSPTWDNILTGHQVLSEAAAGTLTFTRDDGRVDTVGDSPAALTIRPRGLHLPEPHAVVDDRPVPASLFDVALLATHTAPGLVDRGSGLYLYLPKMQSRHEAEWWDAVLGDVERRTGLAPRSIRVTVLIEHIAAAHEMEAILFALRDRITGLNAGRWDYLFSVFKTLGEDPAHLLPDRSTVTMTVPFLAAYARQLVTVCHRRGAHAIGGMSAFVPDRRDPAATERAFAAVRADKEREAGLGYDGTWVAHPDLIPVAVTAFDGVLGTNPDQRDRYPDSPPTDIVVEALVDTEIPDARFSRAGLSGNLRVALLYVAAWLGGRGAVAIDSLMEDAATAEVSRSQVWQWIRHAVPLDDGTVVTQDVVEDLLSGLVTSLKAETPDADHLSAAANILRDSIYPAELPEFLTLLALPHLG
jgi:malate synthase